MKKSFIRKIIREEIKKNINKLLKEELENGKNERGIYILPQYEGLKSTYFPGKEKFQIVMESEKYLKAPFKTEAHEHSIYIDPNHVIDSFVSANHYKNFEKFYNGFTLKELLNMGKVGENWITLKPEPSGGWDGGNAPLPAAFHGAVIRTHEGKILGDKKYEDVVHIRPLVFSIWVYFFIKRYDELNANIKNIIKKYMSEATPAEIGKEINKSLKYYEKINIEELKYIGITIEQYRLNIKKGQYVEILEANFGDDTVSKAIGDRKNSSKEKK
jgi:hypothetical protein